MKKLTDTFVTNDKNAWGGYRDVTHQHFVVEQDDVGAKHQNYLGMGHAIHQFTEADVGRHVDVLSMPGGYTSWSFLS
jgi:hypothetical protein